MADGAIICPDCANGANKSYASTNPEATADWRIEGYAINYEDAALTCDALPVTASDWRRA